MCLDRVDKTYEQNKRTATVWKTFRRISHDTLSPIVSASRRRYQGEKWERAYGGWKRTGESGEKYRLGFHGFVAKRGAKDWEKRITWRRRQEIHRVEVRDITTNGIQTNYRCIVARQMRLKQSCIDGTCRCDKKALTGGAG